MTVAAMIEIGAGGHSEPGQSLSGAKAAGKMRSAEWGGALGVSASTSSVPAAASFRSSWQSMLASLDGGLKISSEDGTATDENLAAAEVLPRKTSGSNSATAMPTTAGALQRSGFVNAKQTALAAAEKNLSPAGTGAEVSVSQSSLATHRQSTINPALKSGATIKTQYKEETAGNSHSVSTVKSAKKEAASGVAATVTPPEANFATTHSVPVATPAPVAEVLPLSNTEAPPQTSHTDPVGESLSTVTPGSIQFTSLLSNDPGTATGAAIASRNQLAGTVDGTEAVDSLHSDHLSTAVNETGAAANPTVKTAAEANGVRLTHPNDPVTPAEVKSANSSQSESVNSSRAEEVTAAAPAPLEQASTVHAKTSQAAVHDVTQNRNVEEVKSSSSNGLAATTAVVESSLPVKVQPQAESAPHLDSQPGLQTQPAIQSVEVMAAPSGSGGMVQGDAMSNTVASQSAPVSASISKATSLQAASRSSHAAAALHGDRLGQAVPAVQDGSNNAALARDPTAVHTTVNLGGESGAATSKDGSTAQKTFAALDAENSSGTTTWVHAGTRSAEAGFQDPALGWVGVRADASGGGVHASLVPGSAEAAVTLGGHLAGLNAYLAEQHTPVDSLTLTAPEDRSANSGMGQGAQQNMHQGTQQDTGHDAASSRQSSTQVSSTVPAAAAGWEVPAASGGMETTAQAFVPGGTHISVMA
jgi:hypothetical protein